MVVYIVVYKGTVYGVFDSKEKALASECGDLYDTQILERTVSCERDIEQSWRDNPDRSGGQFTDEEINRGNEWY